MFVHVEEDKNGSLCQKGGSLPSSVKVSSHGSLLADGLSVVLDIGSAILTARSSGHLGGGEDGWELSMVGVNGEVCQ